MTYQQQLVGALQRRGIINAEQVEEAQLSSEENGFSLTKAMQNLRLVSDDTLMEVGAELLGMRFEKTLDIDAVDMELQLDLKVGFCREYMVLPLRVEDGVVEVGVVDPLNIESLDALQLFLNRSVAPVVVPRQMLTDAINKVFDRLAAGRETFGKDFEEDGVNIDEDEDLDFDILDGTDDAPIIRAVNNILAKASRAGASDIHIEPFERHIAVRFRVDGVLQEIDQAPKRLHAAISSRIKVMGDLDIAERRIPQDGRIKVRIAGREIDIRLSTLPTSFGERIVMRLLDKTAVLKDLSHIGMSGQVLDNMNQLIRRPYGIVLVTGPTGSGKTTTLYASLSKINDPTTNIITIENPVEYQVPGIGQIQVHEKVGLTFAAGLRSILRQDPDVVMIGEIRDKETAEIAVRASLTGHMVFSTLHTNDAAGAVTRLVDMGVEPFLVATSVLGIMAQRLVRTLCSHCKKKVVPTETALRQVGWTKERFLAESPGYIYEPVGCSECQDRGYRGRTGIYELLVVDDQIRQLIMENTDAGTIKKLAMRNGMSTLRDDGVHKVMKGITTLSEVMRVAQDSMLDLE